MKRDGCVLHQSIGDLTLTTVMATYLSHLPPHMQMEIVNNELRPTLEERGVGLEESGVGLHWKAANPFMNMFCLSSCSSIQASIPHQAASAVLQDTATTEDPTAKNISPVSEKFPSYSHLSASAFPFLVDESFVNSWLAEGYGVSQLLPLTLVETAWNRWPLVYNPEGFAASWIKKCRGEELVCLDATDRYLCLYEGVWAYCCYIYPESESFPTDEDPRIEMFWERIVHLLMLWISSMTLIFHIHLCTRCQETYR